MGTIAPMIVLPYLIDFRNPDEEFWQSFSSDGLFCIFDLTTEEYTVYEHMDNWPFFKKYNIHDISWYQEFGIYKNGNRFKAEQINFFGGRIKISNKNYIQFCIPQFNHVRKSFQDIVGEKIHKESGFIGPKP